MKAKELLKKYKAYWISVEAAVWDDMTHPDPKAIHPRVRRRIAYNAAFAATYELHKYIQDLRLSKKILNDVEKARR